MVDISDESMKKLHDTIEILLEKVKENSVLLTSAMSALGYLSNAINEIDNSRIPKICAFIQNDLNQKNLSAQQKLVHENVLKILLNTINNNQNLN